MKPSPLDEVEVEVLQEGLVEGAMIGIDSDSSIMSQVKPTSQVSTCFFYFAHQAKRNEPFQAFCEPCQASHWLPLASHEMH